MKVGIVVYNPVSESLGYSIRPREFCNNLSILGYDAQIFSPVDVSSTKQEGLVINGLPRWRVGLSKQLNKSGRSLFKNHFTAKFFYRRRILNGLSNQLAKSLLKKVKNANIDILQGETEIAAMAAIKIGKELKIPVVADIHGLLVEEAVQYGFLKAGSKHSKEALSFVSDVLEQSDSIVVVSEALRDYLNETLEVSKSKMFCVPNAGTLTNIARPHRDEPRDLVYAGILEPWERVNLAIESMPHILRKKPGARFRVAGKGSLKKDLIKLTANLELDESVSFAGTIPHSIIANFLIQSDIALLPSTVDIVRKVACPIKLFDYLINGLPVVTVGGLWWSDFVKEHGVGVVAEDEPHSFAEAIVDLLDHPELVNKMSRNAVGLVRAKYNWLEMSKKLSTIYNQICDKYANSIQ